MTMHIRFYLIFSAYFCFLLSDVALAKEWNVGLRIIHVSDPAIHSEIEVAVWYPTQSDTKEENIDTATLRVAKNAKPLSSPKNLIILSHGFAGNFMGHNDTAQFLAKRGYLVATPTHPDLPGLAVGKVAFDPLVARTRHIKLVIDKILNHSSFKASVHQNRIGIIGFSLGTYSALTTIGAKPDLSDLAPYCAINTKDALLCSDRANQRLTHIVSNIVLQPENRIGGAVLLAPAYGPLFSESSLANVKIPIILFSAEKDQELDNRYNAQRFAKFLPNITANEVVKDAGHFVFMAPCIERLKRIVPAICEDSEFVDREAVHQKLNRDIANFFSEVLIGQ